VSANDPKHHRRSIRLPEYDYSGEGAYYVTICARGMACVFGDIVDGRMRLNEWGRIVDAEISKTGELRRNVIIDTYVIMPNHVHLIVVICGDVAQRGDMARGRDMAHGRDMARHVPTSGTRAFGRPQPGSLSSIVGAIKSSITRNINLHRNAPANTIWQGRFYEHIIRNGKSYNTIKQYILENPLQWAREEENPRR
jgi:putative transposase